MWWVYMRPPAARAHYTPMGYSDVRPPLVWDVGRQSSQVGFDHPLKASLEEPEPANRDGLGVRIPRPARPLRDGSHEHEECSRSRLHHAEAGLNGDEEGPGQRRPAQPDEHAVLAFRNAAQPDLAHDGVHAWNVAFEVRDPLPGVVEGYVDADLADARARVGRSNDAQSPDGVELGSGPGHCRHL